MRRRKVYLMVGGGIFSIIAGNRIYQKSLIEGNGYLGDEVVFFAEVASPDAEPEGEEGDTEDDDWGNSEGASDGENVKEGQQSEKGAGEADMSNAEGLPVSSMVAEGKPYEKISGKGKLQMYNSTGTVLVDDAAYELYNYVNSYASRYAKAVNDLTRKLDSSIKVYDIVAPTSVGITFPDNKKKKLNSSDQEEALNNIEKKLSGRENFVPLYDILMQHRTEYIFFRTDHHWTSLGAYYAYCAFWELCLMSFLPMKRNHRKAFLVLFTGIQTITRHLKQIRWSHWFQSAKTCLLSILRLRGIRFLRLLSRMQMVTVQA